MIIEKISGFLFLINKKTENNNIKKEITVINHEKQKKRHKETESKRYLSLVKKHKTNYFAGNS